MGIDYVICSEVCPFPHPLFCWTPLHPELLLYSPLYHSRSFIVVDVYRDVVDVDRDVVDVDRDVVVDVDRDVVVDVDRDVVDCTDLALLLLRACRLLDKLEKQHLENVKVRQSLGETLNNLENNEMQLALAMQDLMVATSEIKKASKMREQFSQLER